jgi:phosphoribosylglycinamide formyltransferase 1
MLSGPRKPQRIAVFISGGGSTLQALLEMQHQIEIAVIVTNRKKALGTLKARRFGKNIIHFNKEMSFAALNQILKDLNIERIFLAGFMKLLPAEFVELWKGKIMNIHPSLLPAYPGLNSAETCWQDNFDMGASIHEVITEVDAGPILLQQKSFKKPKSLTQTESEIFLRRTEQFLLREMLTRFL